MMDYASPEAGDTSASGNCLPPRSSGSLGDLNAARWRQRFRSRPAALAAQLGGSKILPILDLVLDLPRGDVADELRQSDRVAGAGDAFGRHGRDCATAKTRPHQRIRVLRLGLYSN